MSAYIFQLYYVHSLAILPLETSGNEVNTKESKKHVKQCTVGKINSKSGIWIEEGKFQISAS